jgi:hypothetical protein
MISMTKTSNRKHRIITTVGICLLAVAGTVACSPLVSLAGAALGGTGVGSAGSAASGVQGLGAPSLAQNANTTSPVQNHKSTEQAIHEVLDHADGQKIRESCLKGLPPEAKLPVTECTTRLTCIPGVSRALMMRTCPAESTNAQAVVHLDTPGRAAYTGQAWRWNGEPGLCCAGTVRANGLEAESRLP